VLQNAGGLFDEPAPFLGSSAQDRVQLPLTDDDVHLVADAGVGQKLLNVEQTAGRAVDGVLGPTIAKHRPRDRDLGVVDRQCPIGVVDGQGYLGAPQRSTSSGTGEDDVLHLAAAKALGALLAHDPGEGIHDIGLTGTVRAHDARDAWKPRRVRLLTYTSDELLWAGDERHHCSREKRQAWATRPSRCSVDGFSDSPHPCESPLPQPVIVVLQLFDHGLKIANPRPQSSGLQDKTIVPIDTLTQNCLGHTNSDGFLRTCEG